MSATLIMLLFTLIFWGMFYYSFSKDRSRYRNCHLLCLALLSMIPFIVNIAGDQAGEMLYATFLLIMAALLTVPFFLIHNGIVMIKNEGRCAAHLLSLALGVAILVGEILTAYNVILYAKVFGLEAQDVYLHSPVFLATSLIAVTVIYGSVSFLVFMIYSVFLMIIPRSKDFDYVIIHGAGLINGDKVSRLLQERLDKAIFVYRKDPSPTKLIPSGGKGSDESISEAEAMKRYLLEQGIPESDIIMEDQSTTTLENLKFSKDIIDSREERKYTALVTSNYHVYRALRYCRRVGLKCKGIGSHVAFYYWPSALIREFIAVHTEKKHAILFTLGWAFWMWFTVMLIRAN
ncbi:MAG: YdcF family protein [Mogibacterium sp.]|nr:YdcF family protein [Mogibacterium sp.]